MTDKRKRAAPTIDLTATELSAAAAESKAQPQPDPPPQESAEKPEAPPPPPPEESRAQADAPTRRIGAGVYAAAIAAGFAGTALASAVFAALWFAGLLPAPSAASGDQRAQIAALKKQVDELQDRPAPAVNNQALDALRQSVRKLETDIAKLPPGDKTVSERLAAADNAMKSLGVALIALNKRSDDIAAKAAQAQGEATAASRAVTELRASAQDAAKNTAIAPAQLDALQKRVAALDQSVTAARAQIAKTSVTDTTARLALSAAALCDAVISGAPYQVELAQAKSLGADEQALAPLEPFAASGVPTRAALAHQLSDLIPAVLKASGAQKPPAGFFERLQTNASRLVRISPVSAPPGDNPSDVLARIEVQAAKADIADALTDLDKLSNAARAPAQAWIAKAKARQQALTAARQFASDAARALGKPPRGRAQ